jgi:hypothetical protein
MAEHRFADRLRQFSRYQEFRQQELIV